ncbi:TonB-dependent receptor plug domain-containing protein [Sphingobacterium griseoflavum]|uniref:TonB-dependent receptor n=1 Tax=Sphingobacterium griseoflavum TaxID=1474952 RepID=A0ABQ3HWA9_9SPHI|nr:TonB-dependent receptor [Sphingobacterium griseoflavum]GHE33928.1 TonB-dependent receptor [Sphingobacterium griseoflavum]
MKMNAVAIVPLLFVSLVPLCLRGQAVEKDSTRYIEEVRVQGKGKRKMETPLKMTISVDEFLASSQHISFIKRGAYAWEPLLNNMGSERSNLTIDGMHIFGACTDKMDPITSYVESNNLATIEINLGQAGSMHGATVAGGIDLKRRNTAFAAAKTWSGAYQTGMEANNKQFFNLGNVAYADQRFVAEGSFSVRKAGNYSDGNGATVRHSQYNKFNSSVGLAYKTSEQSSLRLDAIFDRAKDVGFPALPMDLWLSRAIITSATYKQLFEAGLVKAWESKVYYNAIEHYMDDTTRPENLVHMDMPGWSTTYGLLSKLTLQRERYASDIQINAFENVSIAEMRMYPQDRSRQTMFAYSWPWVTTRYGGLSMNNSWAFSEISQIHFGGSLGLHENYSKYIEFNRIFHPGASQNKTRVLPSLHTRYELQVKDFLLEAGLGYGHRAPSVSEGYGYYIYNSFDRYDYIGNPDLRNEVSYEGNARISYRKEKFNVDAQANYFHIRHYIIGRILGLGSPMNYQSVGVKGYTSLRYARLFNVSVKGDYTISKHLHWNGILTYARAQDDNGGNLPFIRPLSYQTALHYGHGPFGLQTAVNGDFLHRNYSPEFGEDQTPAYTIWNISADYSFALMKWKGNLQVGAENIFDAYYSTYADWGNIPRMGRNVFASLRISF